MVCTEVAGPIFEFDTDSSFTPADFLIGDAVWKSCTDLFDTYREPTRKIRKEKDYPHLIFWSILEWAVGQYLRSYSVIHFMTPEPK